MFMKPVASAEGGVGAGLSAAAAAAAAVDACLEGVGATFMDLSASNCSSL
jgi:hypothetical protein